MRQTQAAGAPPAIGPLLRQLRRAARVTQSDVAVYAGCSPFVLRKVERGLQEPSLVMVKGYAAACGMAVSTLLERLGVRGPTTPAEIVARCTEVAAQDPGAAVEMEVIRRLVQGRPGADVEQVAAARYLLWGHLATGSPDHQQRLTTLDRAAPPPAPDSAPAHGGRPPERDRRATPRLQRALARDLGVRLRQLREAARLTQAEVAARVECSGNYVSLVERGQRSPSWRYLVGLAQALDVGVLQVLRQAGLLPAAPAGLPERTAELVAASPTAAQLVALITRLGECYPARLAELGDFTLFLWQLAERPPRGRSGEY